MSQNEHRLLDVGDLTGGAAGAERTVIAQNWAKIINDAVGIPEGRRVVAAIRSDDRLAASLTAHCEDGTRLRWSRQTDLLRADTLWAPFAVRLKLKKPKQWRDLAEDVQIALLQLADTLAELEDADDAREWIAALLSADRPIIELPAPAGTWEAIGAIRDWQPTLELPREHWHELAPVWASGDSLFAHARFVYDHVAQRGGPKAPTLVIAALAEIDVRWEQWARWDPEVTRSAGGKRRKVAVFRFREELE